MIGSINLKKTSLRKIFYAVTILSVILFVFGLSISDSFSDQIGNLVGLDGQQGDFSGHLIGIAFCIWAWLIIVGLAIVPKNWLVWTICVLLSMPHLIVIAVSIGYAYGVTGLLKLYLYVLSFGTIVLH